MSDFNLRAEKCWPQKIRWDVNDAFADSCGLITGLISDLVGRFAAGAGFHLKKLSETYLLKIFPAYS